MAHKTFQEFCTLLDTCLSEKAADKGYHQETLDGPNRLYEFIRDTCQGDHHALGEIIMKVRRFEARHDPEDLVKIAAWAFLVWKYQEAWSSQQLPLPFPPYPPIPYDA